MPREDSQNLLDSDIQGNAAGAAPKNVLSNHDVRVTSLSSVYFMPHSDSLANATSFSSDASETTMLDFSSETNEKEPNSCSRRSKFAIRKMYLAAFAALLNILNGGFAASYSAPATVDMKKPGSRIQNLTEDETTWIASLVGIGCVLGAPISALLSQKLGRKAILVYFSIPSLIGWLVIAYAPNLYWIYIGRLLTGFCYGISTVTVPAYVIEISTTEIRGLLGSGFQMAFASGILLVMACGAALPWTWLAVVGAIIIAIGVSVLFFMPESPHWLLGKGRNVEALKAIVFFQGKHFDAEKELKTIQQNQEEQRQTNLNLREFLQPQLYKPLILSLGLMFFQQFSGVNPLMAYTVSIFKETRSSLDPSIATIIVAIVQVIGTFISGLLVDKSGRRILFIVSGVFISIGHLLLGFFEMSVKANNTSASSQGWIPLFSFTIIIGFFALGYGPIPWVVIPEMVPLKTRSTVVGISSVFNALCMFFVTKTYEDLRMSLKGYGAFWVYGGFSLVGSILCWILLPETKGKSLNEIQVHFKKK